MWMQDRFDEGRRVLERSLSDGRKIVDRGVHDGFRIIDLGLHDGRKLFDRSLDEGRKLAGRTYDDGRKLAEDSYAQGRKTAGRSYEDGRKVVGRSYDEGRKVVGRSYDDGRKLAAARYEEGRRALTGEPSGPGVGAVLWPTVLLAAGAGAAFWWWTQWSRGKAESEAAASASPAKGGEGPHVDQPEMVMAHNTAPQPQGHEPVDASDAKLVEPAEELLQHSPVDRAPPRAVAATIEHTTQPAKPTGKAQSLASIASAALGVAPESLNASLAVQGAATGPKLSKANDGLATNGAVPPGVKSSKPRAPRKGPTVM